MWFGKLGIGLTGVLLLVVFPMAAGFETAEAETSEEVVVEQVDNYNGRDQIPATQYASLEAIPGIPYEVPEKESGAKRFMDYRTITDRTTSQWVLQQEAVTDEYGFRRYGGAYMVAMGTYYAQTCGDVFEIVLDSGFSFTALVSDIKRDCDTDEKNQHREGNVVEFIVDSDAIPRDAALMGDMSYGTEMQGEIVAINKL